MKNDIIYYCAQALIHLFNILPRKLSLMLAGFIGEIWYLIGSKDRNIAKTQMEFALGLKGNQLNAYVRACFEMMFKNLADAVMMKSWSRDYIGSIIKVEGFENIDRAYKQGNGVIALTGHIGNFELMAAWLSYYKGFKSAAIGRKLYDERLNSMLVAQREHFNVLNIPTTTSIKSIISALKDGYTLGVLLDQDSRKVRTQFIEFFGKKALTAEGPMHIARKLGTPVVPLAIYRQPDDTYIVAILPPLEFEWTDNKDKDILNALKKCNQSIEQLIRRDPTQWVWIHKRWRTRPSDEIGKSA
ncbi:MAG: lysophospholipid acyltransferase family protein [candidate division Zixibacteria bacterium]|nr:lysophospholipid acyltransferase family protein [candidate division Zixibacteria bacterium]